MLNIVLIDTDAISLDLYRLYLRTQGYGNITVIHHLAGDALTLNSHPDVVFLGNSLGQFQGAHLLDNLRSLDPAVDVILLPSPAQAGHFEPARSPETISMSGVDNYVLDYMGNVLSRLNIIRRFARQTA